MSAPGAREPRGRVAIGLPVFNGMPYLPEALSSLLAQDEPDIEMGSATAHCPMPSVYCVLLSAYCFLFEMI